VPPFEFSRFTSLSSIGRLGSIQVLNPFEQNSKHHSGRKSREKRKSYGIALQVFQAGFKPMKSFQSCPRRRKKGGMMYYRILLQKKGSNIEHPKKDYRHLYSPANTRLSHHKLI